MRVVVEGLRFPEGPRWHDGALWFSDMHAGAVRRWDESVLEVPGQPSGLGWDPEGRMLVVSMEDRRLLRDGEPYADLSGVATGRCNDMVVDGLGRAYVGNFGFDYLAGEAPRPAAMAFVDVDGSVSVAAEDLEFPNGTVITPDGGTLIVGESFGRRLTAFSVAADGSLSDRRVWAALPGRALPDGTCLDADGAVWAASPTTNEVLRVAEGGEVLDRVETDRGAYACMLGGGDRRTLFVCVAEGSLPAETEDGGGQIVAVDVDVPGAGWP